MPRIHGNLGVNMIPSKTKLRRFLRKRRLKLGLSQVQISRAIGVVQEQYFAIERGMKGYRSLKPKKVVLLASVFGCAPEDIQVLFPKKGNPKWRKPKNELGRLIHSRMEELEITPEELAKGLKRPLQDLRASPPWRKGYLQYATLEPLAKTLQIEPQTLIRFLGQRSKSTKSALGSLVRKRRRELRMSQADLAGIMGVSNRAVSAIELGRTPLSMNVVTLKCLAMALNLKISKLEAVKPERRERKGKVKTGDLGRFLADRRVGLSLMQWQLAERVRCAPSEICYYERGIHLPRPKRLEKLTQALRCEIPPDILANP